MRHRDFIQNITITLLTLSAVFLFSRYGPDRIRRSVRSGGACPSFERIFSGNRVWCLSGPGLSIRYR